MKTIKTRSFSIILLILILNSCRSLTEFDVDDSASFVVPAGATIGTPVIDSKQIASSSSFQFKAYGTDEKHVKEIRLQKLSLTITNPASEDFSFLNSIYIYISATGLPEIEMAHMENIPPSIGNTIDLVTTQAVLDGYVKGNNYSIRIRTITDEVLLQDITIRADMKYRVRAKLL